VGCAQRKAHHVHAIETYELTKRFRRVEAVCDLNLKIESGSIYALMGPNGAGKTTLIKMLMNLVRPTSGSALMLGGDASALRGRRLEAIGYVSENQKMPDWMTVEEFLKYWRPFYPSWDTVLERNLADRFALPLKRKIKNMSRGMRMKAALASALAYRPKLLVLDEPLSGLDPLVRDDLMEALLEQSGETTVLISSHDLAEIDNFASHVGFIDGGRLRLSEPMKAVREQFKSVKVESEEVLRIPSDLPPEWIRFSTNGQKAQWSETSWDAQRSEARIHEVFGAVDFATSPMALREVFLALAKPTSPSGGMAVTQ
jgi:ABC-2 type transport system ATP-binding protein